MNREIKVGDVYDTGEYLVGIKSEKLFSTYDVKYKLVVIKDGKTRTTWHSVWMTSLHLLRYKAKYIGKLKPWRKRLFSKQIWYDEE